MNTDPRPGPAPEAVPHHGLASAPPAAAESALYRRVWRWHFYAGLVCLPFLVLLAVTGGLYLYKDAIEARLYADLRTVPPRGGPPLAAQGLVARALAAEPGQPVRFVAPPGPGRSAEVGVRTARGVVALYLDPHDGRVIGRLADEDRLMDQVRALHGLALAGPLANHWMEVVAGWAIVLVVSGVFLWWPRGGQPAAAGGAWRVRGRPRQRIWWRDLHAVTGSVAAAAIVFLAVTGMPWSAFWGQHFGRISTEWGLGMPRHFWGPAPASSLPLKDLGSVPWTVEHAPLPQSSRAPGPTSGPASGQASASTSAPALAPEPAPEPAPASAHAAHGHAAPVSPAEGKPDVALALSIGLDAALRRFADLGLPAGTPVRLPEGERGVYIAVSLPADVRGGRVVHLDRYSGAVLADVGYAQFGPVARVTEWGIALHTGRQFGWINQLVMLAGCLAIVLLAVSAVVMWWKRRPAGRLAAPPRRQGDRLARAALVVAMVLGAVYPLLGASMLVALALDAAVPTRWRQRFAL